MNKPKIRFKGFTEDWEQRKFDDLFVERREKTKTENEDKLISCAINGMFLNSELFSHFRGSTTVGYLKIKKNDLILSAQNLHLGNANVNLRFESGIISPAYKVYELQDCNPYFINAWVKDERTNIFFLRATTEGASVCRKNIEWKALGQQAISVPSMDEQTRIGEYFHALDDLITLHQRKCDETQKLKKYMLQKMFPKNGATVPEIRFSGFTEDWEQRKLDDIYGSIGNAFVGTASPYYVESGHFYLESNNIKDGQINHNTEVFINDEFYEKQKDKWLHTGDMVMVQSGHVGHAAVIPEELNNSAAHALIMFRNPKEEIEPYFLNYQYQTLKSKKKIENITTGNTIKHILASEMQQFEVDMPEMAEQKKIAEYFRGLDTLITLHQRKCKELQNMKKFMLQNMFV